MYFIEYPHLPLWRSARAVGYGSNIEGLDDEVCGLRLVSTWDINVEVSGVVADDFVACLGVHTAVQLRGVYKISITFFESLSKSLGEGPIPNKMTGCG